MKKRFLAAGAAVLVTSSMGFGETLELSGTIRDLKADHVDFERTGSWDHGVVQGIVLPDLGADGKPQRNASCPVINDMVDSDASFAQWFNDAPGVNIAIPYTISLDNGQSEPGGVYSFAVEVPVYFFPIDGMGWGDTAIDKNGNPRNFYFTYEIHTEFTYTDPTTRDLDGDGIAGETDDDALVFTFAGDDDVWVFINGKLAVDIGGVHAQASDSVNLDQQAAALGLVVGQTYPLDFFFAERHVSESNFRIETTIQFNGPEPTTIEPLFD